MPALATVSSIVQTISLRIMKENEHKNWNGMSKYFIDRTHIFACRNHEY